MAVASSVRSWDEVSSKPSYHPLLPAVSAVITATCSAGDRTLENDQGGRTVFDTRALHMQSVQDYLIRLCKHGFCSGPVWVAVVRLTDRWSAQTGRMLTSSNIFKLILACYVVAAKLRDDVHYSMKYYAEVGGVSKEELLRLELQLLSDINFDTSLGRADYQEWCSSLQHYTACSEDPSTSSAVSAAIPRADRSDMD
eukprot:TRINITY_DN4699_c0_g1_i1.p2 TRINITY_DN4699_c0_g1~~TRINITY_DN4699_c0_g1_i1.p2  ORF type:complete len:197 (+),score=60.53 TRINITY_DN4699_c0_g1_i1:119-709(+)